MSECAKIATNLSMIAPFFESLWGYERWVREQMPDETMTVQSNVAWGLYMTRKFSKVWKRIDETRYDEMLNILPPVARVSKGFMVGEPWDHDVTGQPRFTAFLTRGGEFFEALYPMTVAEWRALDPASIVIAD